MQIQRWLADELARVPYDIYILGMPHSALCDDMDMTLPEFTRDQLARWIVADMRSGLLELAAAEGEAVSTDCSVADILELMQANLGQHYLGFTAAGGIAWESIAHPIWFNYLLFGAVHADAGNDDSGREENVMFNCRIEGQSPDRLTRYYHYLVEQRVYRIAPQSIAWTRLDPWEATYWKTLPFGWQLGFLAVEDEPNFTDEGELLRVELETWHD